MQIPDASALHLFHATLLPGGTAVAAQLPANEDERLAALQDYQLLDTAPEPVYDAFTSSAAEVCGTPMALISLIDTQRQWFKSKLGMAPRETPRELSFCAHAILEPDQVMEVGDTHQDGRFVGNALVTGEPQIRFYAGAPLLTSDGIALGTLCVLDRTPRRLSVAERDALQALARQVVDTIEPAPCGQAGRAWTPCATCSPACGTAPVWSMRCRHTHKAHPLPPRHRSPWR